MSSKRVRNLFTKFGRTKSQSTTDLSEWSKSDEKLMKAVEANDAKKVSSILSKKAMVPSKLGPRGHSIFHVACALGNAQIVELLLKETDDVNDLTIQGNTCLQLAAAKGHQQVVQRLVQSGAEIDMRDSNDMTALHHACAGLHYGCVHFLLQGGADPRCTEKGGKTPLFYAAHRGDIGICKLLVDKGADVNAGDKMQITPLMVAAKEGNRGACEFLLKRGANPNTSDRDGHVALYYAMTAGHPDLREVFANAPTHASWDLNNSESGASRETQEGVEEDRSVVKPKAVSPSQADAVLSFSRDTSPVVERPADAVQSLTSSDAETISQSEDEGPSLQTVSDPSRLPEQEASPRTKDTQAYKELESEHEQLSEEYHSLSIENLRLRDKVDFLQQRMNSKHEQVTKDPDSWHDSDDDELFGPEGKKTKGGKSMNDKQMVALLRSQILTLRQENDQLRNSAQALHNGYRAPGEDGGPVGGEQTDLQGTVAILEAEKEEMKAEVLKTSAHELSELKACWQLKESAKSQQLSRALGQEQLLLNNASLQAEVESLRSAVEALEQMVASLEEEKAALPSDKVAVLNSAKVMEEVKFDEEGFVEGQDLTKEEFLQAQNEQLKMQCSLLTEELSKLRQTFDAILKAGDNLQADYDQLQAEKEKLQDQLEGLAREKEEVVKENEFLLSDGNALHEDLKKLVQELEKIQEKYRMVCAEKEQLQHQQNAVTIAGKVGEVARLLEEREKMQARLAEAEETAGRLSHDQAILLEEVQSQQDRITALTAERDTLQAEMDDAEALVAQHEALTQDYAQLELDFNELLKEKEQLEAELQAGEGGVRSSAQLSDPSPDLKAVVEERDLLIAERDQLELTIQELSKENAVLEEELESVRSKLVAGAGGLDVDFGSTAQLELTVKELAKENAELEEELANTQEQMADLEAQLEAKGGSSEEGDVEALRASVSQLETTVKELSRENADLEEELSSVKAQLAHSQEALENRLSFEGVGSASADVTIDNLKREKQELAHQVEQLQRSLADGHVNGEVAQASAPLTVDRMAGAEEGWPQTVARLEADNARLQEEVDAVRAQLAALEGSHNGALTPVNGILTDPHTGSTAGKTHEEMEEITRLKEQASYLQRRLSGHMDPAVKEALHSIIEMRSMEQFC